MSERGRHSHVFCRRFHRGRRWSPLTAWSFLCPTGAPGGGSRESRSYFGMLAATPALSCVHWCTMKLLLSTLSGGVTTSDISMSGTGALPAAASSIIFKFPSVTFTIFPSRSSACIVPSLVHEFFTSGCCCTDLRRSILMGVRSSIIPLPLSLKSLLFCIT